MHIYLISICTCVIYIASSLILKWGKPVSTSFLEWKIVHQCDSVPNNLSIWNNSSVWVIKTRSFLFQLGDYFKISRDEMEKELFPPQSCSSHSIEKTSGRRVHISMVAENSSNGKQKGIVKSNIFNTLSELGSKPDKSTVEPASLYPTVSTTVSVSASSSPTVSTSIRPLFSASDFSTTPSSNAAVSVSTTNTPFPRDNQMGGSNTSNGDTMRYGGRRRRSFGRSRYGSPQYRGRGYNRTNNTKANGGPQSVQDSSPYRRTDSRLSDFSPIVQALTRPHRDVTIRFFPRPGTGFGNMMRAFRSLLILSIYDNYTICFDYSNYYLVMNSSLDILRCKVYDYSIIWRGTRVDEWVKDQNCNLHFDRNRAISGSNDMLMEMVKCPKIRDALIAEHIPCRFDKHSLSQYFGRFLFQPKQSIIDIGNKLLDKMTGVRVGLQLRFGGKIAEFQEGFKFIKEENIGRVVDFINKKLQSVNNYTFYLSSDSKKAPKLLAPLNASFVMADAFEIGHTRGKNLKFMERAILDLYVLSKCDILFTTWFSTYGNFARDLSDSRRIYMIKYCIVCTKIELCCNGP